MLYPTDVFFDIETLINVSQPSRILLLGNCDSRFLNNYVEQKGVINQLCDVKHLTSSEIESLKHDNNRYDVAIVVDLLEHLDKQQGMQILSRLRDIMCPHYCVCLPVSQTIDSERWHLTDLFSFALNKVSSYTVENVEYGLFKYSIDDYKKTPDWLNPDNWANPEMWGKYWW